MVSSLIVANILFFKRNKLYVGSIWWYAYFLQFSAYRHAKRSVVNLAAPAPNLTNAHVSLVARKYMSWSGTICKSIASFGAPIVWATAARKPCTKASSNFDLLAFVFICICGIAFPNRIEIQFSFNFKKNSMLENEYKFLDFFPLYF